MNLNNRNRRYRNRLLVSTAMAGATLLGLGQNADAACTPAAPPNYVCSGLNTTGQIVPSGIGLPLNAGDLLTLLLAPANPAVTTDPGFSVSTSDPFALGILGKGAVSYTDANSSALSSTTGIGLGVVSLVPQVAPPYYGPNPGGAVTIDTNGALTGALIGLAAINTGDGATAVNATGDITATGANGYGVLIYSLGSDADVTTGRVSGTNVGISAINQGATAALSITANGDVTGGTGDGIHAVNGGQQLDVVNTILNGTVTFSGPTVPAGSDLNVTAYGKVTGGRYGIFASNDGSGATSIIATTAAVAGSSEDGIYATNGTTATDLTVSAAAVSGKGGIAVTNNGTGFTSVTATGLVTGASNNGIDAYTDGAGLTVSAAAVNGGFAGIYAQNNGTGATSVTATGTVTGTVDNGIDVYTQGTGLTVSAVTVNSGENGIRAYNSGDGATDITATGAVSGTGSDGIFAFNNTAATGGLTIDAVAVSGGKYGIYAENQGTGVASITAKGDVMGTGYTGIAAVNGIATFNPDGTIASVAASLNATDLTVDAAAVSGSHQGIYAYNAGSGATKITAKGLVTGLTGIHVTNAGGTTSLTVDAAAVEGFTGIYARNFGTGATSITATGAVTGNTDPGIDVANYGTDLTVEAVGVSGDSTGLAAFNFGTGATKVTAKGAATGTFGAGIQVRTGTTTTGGVTIDAAAASGGQFGILAENNGAGATTITATGTVEGGNAAIKAMSSAGQAISITTSGLVRNSSQIASLVAVETSGGPVTFTNNGGLLGTVKLGTAANIVANNATWNTAGINEFGGGTLTNDVGKDIVTAAVGYDSPVTTTFKALSNFTNNGRLTMANGIAGDVTNQFAGDATFAAGSVLAVDINGTGASDRFAVEGTADLSGATLAVTAQGLAVGTYTVVSAGSGLGGTTFQALTGVTSTPFLSVTDTYDANNAYLDVTKVRDFADAGLTPNQIATGEGLDSLTGGAVFNAVAGLATDAEAQAAFDQLSGEIHASAKGMLVEDSRFVRDAATSRIRAAFGDVGAAALPVMAYGEGGPEMVAADTDRFAVWGQAFGSWGNTDSDGNAAAFDRSTGGLLAGADTLVGGWRVGLLGGYSHSSFDADRNSSGKSDSYHLGLYGGTNWGAIAFRTGAAYSWSSLSTKRSVAFNDFTDRLSADYDAGTAQVFGELAYKADAGQFRFEPFANLAYVSVHTDGFTEDGGDAALTSAGTSTDATFTTLGLRGSSDFAFGGMNATVRGMLGWRHAFGDVTPTSSFVFAGGDHFTIAGVPIARDSAVVEAGLDFNMSANATLGLAYTGQFGGGTVDQGAKVDLAVKF
ncbi:autotransporter domain-containing protein [Mesorhizobium sp. M0088]|uniref:autotransporter outer membrane beta-barrel domain-containing protein n=2 Tax=unclassified Mesorhizobium TaxID=325217 RepID=UPI0033353347